MFAIVGLGNPGPSYSRNRHNAGFMVIDELAGRLSIPVNTVKWHGITGKGISHGESIVLMKPLTYMNRSGLAVAELIHGLGLPLENTLIVLDDVSLPLGRLRLRPGGSSGGHNGLEDILLSLDTRDLPRLRLGVGDLPAGMDLADFVLEDFSPSEEEAVGTMISQACDAVLHFLEAGMERAMQQINTKENLLKEEHGDT